MSKRKPPYHPPRWPDKLLEWCCAPHLVEEVIGDLHERYYLRAQRVGALKARKRYWRDVLAYVRPSIFKRKKFYHSKPIYTGMLRNYFIIAFRNITRNKAFSVINILGLALGLTCSLLIYLWVQGEHGMDNFHVNGERLFLVYQRTYVDSKIQTSNLTPGALTDEIKKVFPEIEYACKVGLANQQTFQVDDKILKMESTIAGADFFKMFSYTLLYGTPETALNSPTSLAISRKMAEAFFVTPEAAMGQIVRVDNQRDLMVTAVFENLPAQASEKFDCLISVEALRADNPALTSWNVPTPPTCIQLHPEANPKLVDEKIRHFLDDYIEQRANIKTELGLQRFGDRYLYSDFENGVPRGGRIEYVRLFSVIAVFILLIACINFMNLATARSVKRAKEIGIRKVVGAARWGLIKQFIGEALLLTFFAIMVSLILMGLVMPGFNTLIGKQIDLPILEPSFWLFLMCLMIITGIVAGNYPAFFLSSLQPVRILKGTLKFSAAVIRFRKGLVIFQFILSIVLIIATLVISQQTEYMQNKHLGYERENLIHIPLEGELRTKYSIFKQEVSHMPGIKLVDRISQTTPQDMGFSTTDMDWEGKDPDITIAFIPAAVGYDFVKLMGLEVIQGRDFSKEFATDSLGSYLVNEEAVKRMGLEDPIGKSFTFFGKKGEIIGVLKDFHFKSLHQPIQPFVARINESFPAGLGLVRTAPGKTKEALASLEQVWKEINPNYSFTYSFADDEYEKLYRSEQVITTLSNAFGILAIFISCLGLLGLAMFSAEQRTKEIGIRKVLGASVSNIVAMFSKDFLQLVGISFLIATPIAWFAMNKWLQAYAYRIDLVWWIFALAGVLALLVALLTVSFQAIKAAVANPVDSLKNE